MAFFRGIFHKHAFHKSKSDSNVTFLNDVSNKNENKESCASSQLQNIPESVSSDDKVQKLDDHSACSIIKQQIKSVSEEVCTILSLIPLLSTIEEGREMDGKLKTLDNTLQSLLAPLHYYMTALAPEAVNKDMWDLERQQVNREYECTVENFRAAQKEMRLEIVKLNSKKRF